MLWDTNRHRFDFTVRRKHTIKGMCVFSLILDWFWSRQISKTDTFSEESTFGRRWKENNGLLSDQLTSSFVELVAPWFFPNNKIVSLSESKVLFGRSDNTVIPNSYRITWCFGLLETRLKTALFFLNVFIDANRAYAGIYIVIETGSGWRKTTECRYQ